MAGIPNLSSIPDPDPDPDDPVGDRSPTEDAGPSLVGQPADPAPEVASASATDHDASSGETPDHDAGADEPTVELPAVPPTPEPPPTQPPPVEQQATPSAAPVPPRRRRRALRTVIALVIVGGLAAGAFAAWPALRDRYVTPVQTNTDDIEALTARVDAAESRLGELTAAEDRFGAALVDTTDRIDDLDDLIAEQDGRIDDLDDLIAEQNGRIDDLDDLSATLGEDLATSRTEAAAAVQVLRATELLGRARLFMFQANYGMAADDMRAAREILASLPADDPAVGEAIERLDRAIATATAFPVVAAADLDIAWQLLLAGSAEG